MRCLVSPSPALSSASMTVRPPCKLPTSMWQASRPAPSFPRLKLARRPRCPVVRAQRNHGGRVQPPEYAPNHFVEEGHTIIDRSLDIYFNNCKGRFLHYEALNTSALVCGSALTAVMMASQLVDSGALSAGLSTRICADTVYTTLRPYVDVFLNVSKDCYNGTLDRDTAIRFLDGLRGLASVSHILLEDALEALSHTHPRESLLEYAFNSDVKKIHHDFNCQMDDLEDGIRNPKLCNGNDPLELVFPGLDATESFLAVAEPGLKSTYLELDVADGYQRLHPHRLPSHTHTRTVVSHWPA